MTASEEARDILTMIARGHEARTHFIVTGEVHPGVRPVVAEAWTRSTGAPDRLDEAWSADGVRRRTSPHWRVHALAARLRSAVAPAGELGHVAVLVVDRAGIVVGHRGESNAVQDAVAAGLGIGSDLSEAAVGASAVGISMATGEPAQVAGPEHLSPSLTAWSTVAAPLRESPGAPPIGYLCAAERTARVSHMVTAWLGVAAAVIEAEWRLHP